MLKISINLLSKFPMSYTVLLTLAFSIAQDETPSLIAPLTPETWHRLTQKRPPNPLANVLDAQQSQQAVQDSLPDQFYETTDTTHPPTSEQAVLSPQPRKLLQK